MLTTRYEVVGEVAGQRVTACDVSYAGGVPVEGLPRGVTELMTDGKYEPTPYVVDLVGTVRMLTVGGGVVVGVMMAVATLQWKAWAACSPTAPRYKLGRGYYAVYYDRETTALVAVEMRAVGAVSS